MVLRTNTDQMLYRYADIEEGIIGKFLLESVEIIKKLPDLDQCEQQ